MNNPKEYWNNFAKTYTSNIEQSLMSFALTLCCKLKVEEADSILETACGGGLLAIHNIQRIKQTCKYTLTDFSEEMLAIANFRL